MSMKEFCLNLPKVELHAHLNGSISSATMQRILQHNQDRSKMEGEKVDIKIPKHWETTIAKGERRSLDECFVMFKMTHMLVNDEECIEMVAHDVVSEFAADGVIYLELRSTPRANPGTGMTKHSYVEAVLCGIDRALSERTMVVHVRLLLSIDRRHSPTEALETVKLALVLSKQTQHRARVVGIDLSGDPTVGDVAALVPVLNYAKESGLKLAVHIAEVPDKNEEIALLLSVQPDRLGHATFIHQEAGGSPDAEDKVLATKIPIEMCLTSNVKGQTVSSFDNHHLSFWHKRGHPVVICTDDKGIFSTTLSEEYAIAGQTLSLSQQELWDLAYSAVDCVFESDSLKDELRKFYDRGS